MRSPLQFHSFILSARCAGVALPAGIQTAQDLRRAAVRYMRAHHAYYQSFFADDTYDAYLRQMSLPLTWAEGAVINVSGCMHPLNAGRQPLAAPQSAVCMRHSWHWLCVVVSCLTCNLHTA